MWNAYRAITFVRGTRKFKPEGAISHSRTTYTSLKCSKAKGYITRSLLANGSRISLDLKVTQISKGSIRLWVQLQRWAITITPHHLWSNQDFYSSCKKMRGKKRKDLPPNLIHKKTLELSFRPTRKTPSFIVAP